MKQILSILVSMTPLFMVAQENTKTQSQFTFGVVFSPEYCYRDLQGSNDTLIFFTEWLDSIQEAKFGYTAGFTVSYKVLKYISIESGIMFSNKGFKMIYSDFSGASDPNDPLLMRLSSINQTVSFYYLEIPVLSRFQIVSGKFIIAPAIGLSANIYLDSRLKSIIKYNDGTPDEKEIYEADNGKNFTLSVIAGIGIDYNLSDKLSIGIEPVYKRDIFKSNSSDTFNQYFYSFGANIGLEFRL